MNIKKSSPRAVRLIAILLCTAGLVPALATAEVSAELRAKLTNVLSGLLPEATVMEIFETPLPNLSGALLEGGQVFYLSHDGKHIITGDMFDLTEPVTNLADVKLAAYRSSVMSKVPASEMVVFSPEGEARTHINVFTDVDCGYCRKLHMEMADLNAYGIEVRYLAYPRAGTGTPTYDKIVSAWCSDDRNSAMTALKSGQTIPARSCDNPVDEQFEIGQQVGVRGTPAIVTADGRMLPGYMPAPELAAALGLTAGE